MKPEQSLFTPAWWGTSLENVGLEDQRPDVGTYGRYEFASLPELPVPLDGELGWLARAPAHDYHIGIERAAENSENLFELADQCDAAGVSLPRSFMKFARDPTLQARIRSNTHCYLDLVEAPVQSPIGNGVLVRFLSDSQGCMFWYLYIPTGLSDHAVVSSPDLYDPSGERLTDEEPDPRALVFSAESFEAFLCRFWIENELWYSGYKGTPMSEECRRYLDMYAEAPPDPLSAAGA